MATNSIQQLGERKLEEVELRGRRVENGGWLLPDDIFKHNCTNDYVTNVAGEMGVQVRTKDVDITPKKIKFPRSGKKPSNLNLKLSTVQIQY